MLLLQCLLAWIETKTSKASEQGKPVKCPQCQVEYKLDENKPFALSLFEKIDGLLEWSIPFVGGGVLLGSVVHISQAYGLLAIKLFMGQEAADVLLARPWPWHFYLDISSIPWSLIGGRLRILESFVFWLPSALALPLAHLPIVFQRNGMRQATTDASIYLRIGGIVPNKTRFWPPSPAVTMIMIPWFRHLFSLLKKSAYAMALRQFRPTTQRPRLGTRRTAGAGAQLDGQQQQQPRPAQPGAPRTPDRRVIVLGPARENDLLQAPDPPPGVDAIREEEVPRRQAQPEAVEIVRPARGNYHEDGDTDSEDEEEAAGAEVLAAAEGEEPERREVEANAAADEEEQFEMMRMLGPNAHHDVLRPNERIDNRLHAGNADARLAAMRDRQENQRVALVGALFDPRPASPVEEAPDAARADGADNQAARGGEGDMELRQTVYISPTSIFKLCLGALALPFIARGMGDILKVFAKHSHWLARFLGIRPEHFHAAASRTSAAAVPVAGASILSRMWSGATSVLADDTRVGSGSAGGGRYTPTSVSSSGLFTAASAYDELEPVWWRNAVGAAVYVVVRDASVLAYRYLRLRHRGKKSVRDIPFDPKLVEGLELRDGVANGSF